MDATWRLVMLQLGGKSSGCKWMHANKERSHKVHVQYKASLVTKGFTQRKGISYNEVFSQVVKIPSTCGYLTLVA